MALKVKSLYIYHAVIWFILVSFKIMVDYSFFGKFLLVDNLRIFSISVLIFYINYALILPKLIKQKRSIVFIFIAVTIILYLIIMFGTMPPPPFDPEMMKRGPRPFPKPGIMMPRKEMMLHDIIFKIGFFAICFSTILFFVDKWVENKKIIKDLEFQRQSSELKILREQINPHFFFNALNSIYSLSITKSNDTPRVVLILSDIMRYALNSKNGQKNNLDDEILNIKKYVEVQSIRFSKFNNIKCEFWGDFSKYKIEPLLLLTFVENAFKYADFTKGPLQISVNIKNGILDFQIHNYYEKQKKPQDGNKMGIKNTKQKLDLLYPDFYTLNINDDGSQYQIRLTLNLNSK